MIAETASLAPEDAASALRSASQTWRRGGGVNPTQIKILANHWNRVCQANLWHAVNGGMVAESRGTQNASEFHQRVWKGAEELAEAARTNVAPMDLRNSACLLTIGAVKAPADMDQPEFVRLMTLYSLLIDPEDQTALIKWRS